MVHIGNGFFIAKQHDVLLEYQKDGIQDLWRLFSKKEKKRGVIIRDETGYV